MLRSRVVAGVVGSLLALGTVGVATATSAQADGYYRCRPTAPTLVLGASMYGATYVTGGTLVDVRYDDFGAVNCRYTGKRYTVSTYGGGGARYDGPYSWWAKNFYLCATSPGTCTP